MNNDNQLPPAPVAEELSNKTGDLVVEIDKWSGVAQVKGDGADKLKDGQALYTHPQPAVPDVDDLALMLWENDRLVSSIHTRVEAERIATIICNWIEEQSNDQ